MKNRLEEIEVASKEEIYTRELSLHPLAKNYREFYKAGAAWEAAK